MATSFNIPSINWGNSPGGAQTITLEYKLYSDSSWTLIDSSVNVDVDGLITDSPLPSMSGLTDGQLYYVRASNNCASPVDYILIPIQL
jgi:hypothetical protein